MDEDIELVRQALQGLRKGLSDWLPSTRTGSIRSVIDIAAMKKMHTIWPRRLLSRLIAL